MAPLLFLRDIHLAGAGIFLSPSPMHQGEFIAEPRGGMVIVDEQELRRFALDCLKLVGEE